MTSKIICDSSSLISLSSTCLVKVLDYLTQRGGEFLIPDSVQREIVETPLQIKKYAFSAVRLKKSIDDGVLKAVQVPPAKTQEVLENSNNVFKIHGKPLKIVHEGEAACVAAYNQFKCAALLIDEKTTKLLIENPAKLQETISAEYHTKVEVNQPQLDKFAKLTKGIDILRSSDLAALAAQRGYFSSFKAQEQAFHTAIYAIRNAGCSLTENEITEYEGIKP